MAIEHVEEGEEYAEIRSDGDVIADAAAGKQLQAPEAQRALDFFLSEEGQAVLEEEVTHTLVLNFGGPTDEDWRVIDPDRPPRKILWTIKPVEETVITRIFREAAGAGGQNRAQGRRARGPADENTNLRIVAAGTADPAPEAVAQATGIADPTTAFKAWFRRKPGLITQVADAILDLSGFNDDDVRDAREVRAAQG